MKNRLLSLDIFRGMTIFFMIIVNTAGNWRVAFAPLLHAKWDGFTPTDLVFPSFVFITGVSSWFSFRSYNHTLTNDLFLKIWKRAAIIFLLGVLMYAFPFVGHPLSTWRILGVLQRIALCYGVGATLGLLLSRKQLMVTCAVILLGYWGIMVSFGDLSLENNAARTLDLFLFGESHLYHGEGIAFDPEGLLSTLPALGTYLIGYLLGGFIGTTSSKEKIMQTLSVVGMLLVIGGLVWDLGFPINKKLWTSSYVLFAGGLSTLIFTLCYYLADVKGYSSWGQFFRIFGTNAILAYLISEILIMSMGEFIRIQDGEKVLNGGEALYKYMFVSTLGDNAFGSLAYSLFYTFICWLIVYVFYRNKIFLKV